METTEMIEKSDKILHNIPDSPYYPRPQLRRDSFVCLDGEWEFCTCREGTRPDDHERIRVPFPMESSLSGIERQHDDRDLLYYRRSFILPEGFFQPGKRLLFHCEGLDQYAKITLNGTVLGEKLRFPQTVLDVTAAAFPADENIIEIAVRDDLSDQNYPWGKQKHKRGGMWYTSVSGIWQTVWLECVPMEYVQAVRLFTSCDSVRLEAEGVREGEVVLESGERFALQNGTAVISPKEKHLWSPENPYLYTYEMTAGEDRVLGYFALKSVEIKNEAETGIPRIFLNGKPIFFHGLLDQGYIPDGIWNSADPEWYRRDIEKMKSLGFNTLRKHIKIESERFYYECDRQGMIVFQDAVNSGKYSFLRDTALPTAGVKHFFPRRLGSEHPRRKLFESDLAYLADKVRNHPCVCYITLFNEGWGQFNADEEYDLLRSMNTGCIIDTASGWFIPKRTDVDSRHVYFKPFRVKTKNGKQGKSARAGKPLILSEFGGYALRINGHCYNENRKYGYRFFDTKDACMDAIEKLYLEQILPAIPMGLCGCIYTQLSDVEDEVNGLMTYDRQIVKVDGERMRKIAEKLISAGMNE